MSNIADYWGGKTNSSPKQKKIQKRLEELGHTDVHVWWEPIGGALEMCGNEGGFFFCSDQEEINPLGYSFDDAIEALDASWCDVTKEVQTCEK